MERRMDGTNERWIDTWKGGREAGSGIKWGVGRQAGRQERKKEGKKNKKYYLKYHLKYLNAILIKNGTQELL